MSMTQTGHSTTIDDIEVLRAVAVGMVFISHLFFLFPYVSKWYEPFATQVKLWGGVDLFFAISGFVIARGLLKTLDGRSFPGFVGPFWARRAFRIWPLAWVSACAILLATKLTWLVGASNFSAVFPEWLSVITQTFNLRVVLCNEQCPVGSAFFTPFWSLALEEQFYVILPFVLYFLPRKLWVPLAGVLIAVQFATPRPTTPLNWGWYVRTDAILFGVLIALGAHNRAFSKLEPTFLSNPFLRWPLVIALIFVIGRLPVSGIPIHTGLMALASAALVFVASFDKGYIMAPSWLRGGLKYVGSRSFAIYLLHLPVLGLVRSFWGMFIDPKEAQDDRYTLLYLIPALVGLWIVVELAYQIIENPARRFGIQLLNRLGQKKQARAERPAASADAAVSQIAPTPAGGG